MQKSDMIVDTKATRSYQRKSSTGGYDRATKPATTNPHPNVADTIQEHEAMKEYTVMTESRSR